MSPPRRSATVGAGLLAVVVGVTTCSYPDFRYDEGEDDDEGAGGSGPSSSSSGPSSSSGGPTSQVPCGEAPSVQCASREVCCLHDSEPALDHCGSTFSCGPMFIELACNDPADCGGEVCCAKDNELDALLDAIVCQASCGDAVTEFVVCASNADCAGTLCQPLGYPGYSICEKP